MPNALYEKRFADGPLCYRTSEIPVDPALQCQRVDDVAFYRDGQVRLADKVVAYGVPIDAYVFGAGFIAERRLDVPQFLYITRPDMEVLTFEYRPLWGSWRRWVPLDDPRFERWVVRHGPRRAKLLVFADKAWSAIIGYLLLAVCVGLCGGLLFIIYAILAA